MAAGAESLVLAEPWVLRGYQEAHLREFLTLLPVSANIGAVAVQQAQQSQRPEA